MTLFSWDSPWLFICLLGSVIFVFAWLRSKRSASTIQSAEIVKEMEATFEQFAQDMEADNEQLLQQVKEWKVQSEQQISTLKQQIELIKQELQELKSRTTQQISMPISSPTVSAGNDENDENDEEQDESPVLAQNSDSISERYEELYQLYMQGKSIEYIAKKLEMNKGEVQLIVTLAEQEATLREQK